MAYNEKLSHNFTGDSHNGGHRDGQKEEGRNSDTCYNIDRPETHCYARKKPDTKRQTLLNGAYTMELELLKVVRCWSGAVEVAVEGATQNYCLMGLEFSPTC